VEADGYTVSQSITDSIEEGVFIRPPQGVTAGLGNREHPRA